MIELKQVPWPLWAYSAVMLLGVIEVEARAHAPILAMVLYLLVVFAWIYLLLRGVRWVWIATVGLYVLGLIMYLIADSINWEGIALSLIGLLLLLLPATRRYFSGHRTVVSS
jgi:membrane-bound ClpP family serine protease